MIKKIKNNGYQVTDVDPVIDKIVFNGVLLNGLYAVPYFKMYLQDPCDKTIATIALIDLVQKHGITYVADKFKVNYTTIWRNYEKTGTRIGPRLTSKILKTDPTIKLARVALQACRNEYLIKEWDDNNGQKA